MNWAGSLSLGPRPAGRYSPRVTRDTCTRYLWRGGREWLLGRQAPVAAPQHLPRPSTVSQPASPSRYPSCDVLPCCPNRGSQKELKPEAARHFHESSILVRKFDLIDGIDKPRGQRLQRQTKPFRVFCSFLNTVPYRTQTPPPPPRKL